MNHLCPFCQSHLAYVQTYYLSCQECRIKIFGFNKDFSREVFYEDFSYGIWLNPKDPKETNGYIFNFLYNSKVLSLTHSIKENWTLLSTIHFNEKNFVIDQNISIKDFKMPPLHLLKDKLLFYLALS